MINAINYLVKIWVPKIRSMFPPARVYSFMMFKEIGLLVGLKRKLHCCASIWETIKYQSQRPGNKTENSEDNRSSARYPGRTFPVPCTLSTYTESPSCHKLYKLRGEKTTLMVTIFPHFFFFMEKLRNHYYQIFLKRPEPSNSLSFITSISLKSPNRSSKFQKFFQQSLLFSFTVATRKTEILRCESLGNNFKWNIATLTCNGLKTRWIGRRRSD